MNSWQVSHVLPVSNYGRIKQMYRCQSGNECCKGPCSKSLLSNLNKIFPTKNLQITCIRSSHERCSVRKGVLENFSKFKEKHLCRSLLACSFIKKETTTQVFSCEF